MSFYENLFYRITTTLLLYYTTTAHTLALMQYTHAEWDYKMTQHNQPGISLDNSLRRTIVIVWQLGANTEAIIDNGKTKH